jgi:5-methylcytosine-specific restriction endonuclease McrA
MKRREYKREESEEYKKIKKKVRRRDKNCCVLCDFKGKKNQVHHIVKYSSSIILRENEKNLCLLCPAHHKMTFGREEHFAPLLNEIVMSKYKNGK